ncbi:MAG: DUF1576 domain-containing protein [Christensenellales bacterium]
MRAVGAGLIELAREPAILITDYIAVAGVGAAFANAGLLMLIAIALLYLLCIEIGGLSVAAVFLMGGFGLFGKNLINIWPILLGACIYARLKREDFRAHAHVALLSTSIAPVVTEFLFCIDLALWRRLLLSILVGVSVGMFASPLAASAAKLHRGYNLYNVGFAVGLIGTVYVSIFRSYGYQAYTRLLWSTGNNRALGIFLLSLFVGMIAMGMLLDRRAPKRLLRIFRRAGVVGSDFIKTDGLAASMMNMGVNGIAAMGYVLLVGGELNGPTIGGILTVAGFGAYGKHVKNIAPIFLGVFLASVSKTFSASDPAILIAALFSTSLAPIAGHYGWAWGVAAGFLNSSVVLNAGFLHGGMNLYNTGFSAGIVAAVMVPLLDAFGKRRARAAGESA